MTLSMTHTINSRQDFLDECTVWCQKFNDDNKVLLAYVRRGPKPKLTIVLSKGVFWQDSIQSVKEGKRKPQGVVAAYCGTDGIIRVGWSLCRKTETFHSKVGLRYALERAIPIERVEQQLQTIFRHYGLQENYRLNDKKWEKDKVAVGFPPQSVRKVLENFLKQARKL